MSTNTTETIEAKVADRFKRETADHKMTVLHDDGLYRHLRFRDPKYGCYWFDLITVPGALIFQGDGETFSFRRVTDMFEFFRHGIWKDGTLHINPVYWAEKLTTDRDSVKQYDQELFDQRVAEYFEDTDAEKEYPGVIEAWKAKFEGVFPDYSAYSEHEARAALDDFEYEGFRFEETWEWDLKGYYWWYLWACHAIVWGISQYDAQNAPAVAVEVAR